MRARTVMGLALAAIRPHGSPRLQRWRLIEQRDDRRHDHGGCIRRVTCSESGPPNYIDSLNPFNYIESQAYTAMMMIYPQLVQYNAAFESRVTGPTRGRRPTMASTGRSSSSPNTKWSDGEPMTAADAAWTINTTVEVQGRCDGHDGLRARERQERRRYRRHDPRDPLLVSGRERVAAAGAVLHPSPSTSGRQGRREGKGLKT